MTVVNPISATDEPLLVSAQGIGVFRAGRWLVRNVDLQVRRGEIVSLIGPNGSGKSTTVRTVLGVLTPDEGTIRMAPGMRVGYLPQRLATDWTLPLTVRQLMGLTGRYSKAEIDAALEDVGIRHLGQTQVQHLSGGELQRALLARAVIRRPDLLVLDEPVQGVDFAGEIALYDLIREIRARLGCGILLISHDLHVVMGQTDTVYCLNGHVCCSGSPQLVASSPEYRQLFGARAADALAIYRHDHDHTHLPDGRVVSGDRAAGSEHDEDHHAG